MMINTNSSFEHNTGNTPAINSLSALVELVQAPFLDNTSKRHAVYGFHRSLLIEQTPNTDPETIDRLASTLTSQFMARVREDIPAASKNTIQAQVARNKRYELIAIEKGIDMLFSDDQVTDDGVATNRLLLIEQEATDYAAVVCQN